MSVSRNASVCTCGSTSRSERPIVAEYAALQLAQLRRGLETELGGEVRARLLVRAQGLCLPAGAVERKHLLGAEALPQRMIRAQHLELGDELCVMAEKQLRVDPSLDGGEPELVEPAASARGEAVGDVGERMPTPECERRSQRVGRLDRARLHERRGRGNGFLEAPLVDEARVDVEAIAAPSRTITSPSSVRRFETYVCSVDRAPGVGLSPQTPSSRESVETTLPACAASNASTVRCFGPPSVRRVPSRTASTGPRRRISTRAPYAPSEASPSTLTLSSVAPVGVVIAQTRSVDR